MKASDTLLTPKQRKEIEDNWFASVPRGDNKLPHDLELELQAEITWDIAFKAGERKVVEWLGTHPHILNSYHNEEWQAFLKSGGIE